MSLASLPGKSLPLKLTTPSRAHSTSPYGRSHILKRRAPTLPNPVFPQFPQRVIRADGSTFVHWTTSPRSLFRLTRDLTNNPLWNSASMSGQRMDEELVGGRVGRFNRKFEGMGGSSSGASGSIDWTDIGEEGAIPEGTEDAPVPTPTKAPKAEGGRGRKK